MKFVSYGHSFLDTNSVECEAIDVCTAQGEKKHSKDYFQTKISHQEYLFKESYAIGLTRRACSLAKVGYMALTSTVHVSLINAEVTKTGTSLLRCLYLSPARDILSCSDCSCHC